MREPRRSAALLLAAVLGAAVLLSSCGSSSGSSSSPTAATTGPAATDLTAPSGEQMTKDWSVFALPSTAGSSPSTGPSTQKVSFTAAQVSTSDGCNTLTGPYTLGSDGAFKLGDLAGTQKACPSPADTRHIDALKAAAKVGLDTRSGFDQLVFTDGNGAIVLVLQDAAGG